MERVAAALRNWLEEHNLPTDGVELRIIMPTEADAHQASRTMLAHLPVPLIQNSRVPNDPRLRIYDVAVTFRSEES